MLVPFAAEMLDQIALANLARPRHQKRRPAAPIGPALQGIIGFSAKQGRSLLSLSF
jgi:hypothetical protein